MAVTCWCKKCGKDVAVGDACPICGGKLGKSTVRSAWCIEHNPAADWMKWNEVMRVLLPCWLVLFAVIMVLEMLLGGVNGAINLLSSGLAVTLLLILLLCSVLVLLWFLLMGSDLLDCVVDSKGIHVQTYVPNPTRLKMALRLKSPSLADEPRENGEMALAGQSEILWKDIRRIQCWGDKITLIFYNPSWWMRVALPCSPFTYEDVLSLCRDKLGKKKNVSLPPEIAAASLDEAPAAGVQISMDEIIPDSYTDERTDNYEQG